MGCASFGGPAAHLGYFQKTFVQKLEWIDQDSYSRLIALSQFLPGPGSSQVGFGLGLRRAGLPGGCAAFIGFTLPSFTLMYALALSHHAMGEAGYFSGIVQGLKLLAVVVVADATLSMARSFCKTSLSAGMAVISAALMLCFSGLIVQMLVLIIAATVGAVFLKSVKPLSTEPHDGSLKNGR